MEKYKITDLEDTNIIGEIDLILDDSCIQFAEELEQEILRARGHQKRIEYYSDNVIVYSYKKDLNLGQDVLIFETKYRNNSEIKVELSYIANRNLYGSHLLYLINRAELKSK